MPPKPKPPELIKLDQTQFDQYHLLLTHIARDIRNQTKEITKWQSIQIDAIKSGLAEVAQAIRETGKPKHGPPAKISFVKLVFPDLKESR